jgi:hypothetical protein
VLHLQLIPVMNNHIPSPASSSTSDTDAYNTADARIHFGPLRSPEKKFHPIVACSNIQHPSPAPPTGPSPRLSTPCSLPPYMIVGGLSSTQHDHSHANVNEEAERSEEMIDASCPETPEYEQLLQDGEIQICFVQAFFILSTHS